MHLNKTSSIVVLVCHHIPLKERCNAISFIRMYLTSGDSSLFMFNLNLIFLFYYGDVVPSSHSRQLALHASLKANGFTKTNNIIISLMLYKFNLLVLCEFFIKQ